MKRSKLQKPAWPRWRVPRELLPGLILTAAFLIATPFFVYAATHHRPVAVADNAAVQVDPCVAKPDTDKLDCYTNYLDNLIKNQGAAVSLQRLQDLYNTDVYVRAQCHPLAHSVGRYAYQFYGSVAKASAFGKEVCWSGYYHGIMEAYMAKFDDTSLMANMRAICPIPTSGNRYSFDHYNCVHGLGHGVTIRFDNDIFRALPYCDALDGSWEQQSCYGGVFMQNIVVDGQAHQSKDIKADDPVYPCNAVAQRQKESCYLMVTSNVLKTVSYNYPKAFVVCDGVEANFVATCYQSMGRDISGNALLDSVQVVTHCNEGTAAYRNYCYIGAVKNAVFDQRGTAKANELCNISPAAYQAICRKARDEAVSSL